MQSKVSSKFWAHSCFWNFSPRPYILVEGTLDDRSELTFPPFLFAVQLLSRAQLFETPWTAARQAFPVLHYLIFSAFLL